MSERNELRHMLHSLCGTLEAICDHMPVGPDGFALRAVIEGGMPALLDEAKKYGPPISDEDLSRAFARGYQTNCLMRAEETTGERDPAAWKQDAEEFVANYEPAGGVIVMAPVIDTNPTLAPRSSPALPAKSKEME